MEVQAGKTYQQKAENNEETSFGQFPVHGSLPAASYTPPFISLTIFVCWQLNDEWAVSFMAGCGSLEGLKREVAAAVNGRTEARTLDTLVSALREAVAAAVDTPVPDSVLRDIGAQEYQAHLHELQMKVSCKQLELCVT